MNAASFTVNQFSLVDEKNAALKDLLTEFSWHDEFLLQLSLPLLSMVEAVSSLEDITALDNFRANLITELKSIKQRGKESTISPALLDKLCFVWAAYFDERVSYGCRLDTTQWQNKTLVSQLFGIRNSGDTFFSLVSQLMEFPKKHLALLKICYLILQLGFKGKYHSAQVSELRKLTADVSFALNELGALKVEKNTNLITLESNYSSRHLGLFTGFSPVSFWLAFIVLMMLGLIIYNQYFGDLYERQNQEYVEMTGDTYDHIRQLQPKKMFIESSGFYERQQSNHVYSEPKEAQQKNINSAPLTVNSATIEKERESVKPTSDNAVAVDLEEPPTLYLVQIGAFQNMARAESLKAQCDNKTYPLMIKESGNKQYVGYLVEGFSQARIVSQFLVDTCNISPYIKEYK